jgi:formylmethanofuran dehydrogenase subunit C
MNCQEMTSYISTISQKSDAFDKESTKLEAKKPLEIKAEIDSIIHEIWRRISPTEKFVKLLENPAVWEKYDNGVVITKNESNGEKRIIYPHDLETIENIFGKFKYTGNITSEHYQDFISFLETFKTWLASHFESICPTEARKPSLGFGYEAEEFLMTLNSFFLRRTMKPESVITIKNLPEKLQYGFASNFSAGKIIIDKVDKVVGAHMSGGEIVIEKAGFAAGDQMTGGRLTIGEDTGPTGYSMKGGKIVVERNITEDNSGSPFAYESTHGTIVANIVESESAGCGSWTDILINKAMKGKIGEGKGGGAMIVNRAHGDLGRPDGYNRKECFATLLVGEYDDNHAQWSNFETYSYDDKDKNYRDLRKQEVVSSYIANDEELTEFKKKRCGLVIINKFSNIEENITEGMDGGIVVLEQLPTSELGKGMNRGAVVIDIPGITKERIRKVLSKDRDYGLILMRVPDPDDQRKTKLMDVED